MSKLEILGWQLNYNSKDNVKEQFVALLTILLLKSYRVKAIIFKWIFGALELYCIHSTMEFLHSKLKMLIRLIKRLKTATILFQNV
jgi:hypothetical protein